LARANGQDLGVSIAFKRMCGGWWDGPLGGGGGGGGGGGVGPGRAE